MGAWIPRTKESILARVECLPDAPGCWLWTGSTTPNGYPTMGKHNPKAWAHRLAFELWVGPIPSGLTLDHLCRTPSCVRPDHLEPVTLRDNIHRGQRTTQTQCWAGHPYDEANLWVSKLGRRHCRICHAARLRRYRSEKKRKRNASLHT